MATSPSSTEKPRRSLMVTLLGIFTMLASAVFIPISLISLLMILSGGYGSQTTDVTGFFIVIVAPSLTFLAGVGLLLRWRVARLYLLAVLAVFIIANIRELASGGKSTTIHTSATGEVTTSEAVWGGPNRHSVPIILFSTAVMVFLFMPSVRREFQVVRKKPMPGGPAGASHATATTSAPPPLPGSDWRVGHLGRDRMFYEEQQGGTWQRLEIDGEMLTGRAHHVIYFPTHAQWQQHPEWARNRREEIVARIKSVFRPPDYEYHGETPVASIAATPVAAPPVPATVPPVRPVPTTHASKEGKPWAVPVALACLWGFSIWMGWLVQDGIQRGEVRDVLKRHSLRSAAVREEKPVMFWFLIGLYSCAGAATAGLGVGLIVLSRRSSPSAG